MTDMKIKSPKNCNSSDIKREIVQAGDCVKAICTYPNGFVLETIMQSDEITVNTNRPLIDNGDGTYSIPE
ncbi:hypothetical protein B2H94_10950 [Clostridium sporogenes]|uniref:Uncharacterized protein n=1 Tax=Clostridium sporogenes TaxID=1509 RepID=A0ABD6RNR2_CLOSG|nr:hypothetical protein [Clostridium sporogenes]OSB16701.1 hypothetical protein B2H94_10950 [Clostridium sporogenes]